MAAAIAMAESGGNPNAVNGSNSNGSTDRGLWQINSIHGSQSTLDPLANARAAVGISKGGTDWRPWCTAWSNGRCGGTFLGAGAPVLKFIPGNSTSGVIPTAGTSNPTITAIASNTFASALGSFFDLLSGKSVEDSLNSIAAQLGKYAYFAACVILGIVLIPIGIVFLILSTRPAQGAIQKYVTGAPPPTDVNVVSWPDDIFGPVTSAPPATDPFVEPPPEASVSAVPVTPADPFADPDPTGPIVVPKKVPYKPRHYMKVKKDTTRTVIPKRGDSPDDWPSTPKYVPKH
jgi:hypothetical protein